MVISNGYDIAHGRSGSVLVFAHEDYPEAWSSSERRKEKDWAAEEGTKENDKGGQEHSRLITQNGSKVNTIDVTRVEAQRRSDSLQRDVQACIRFAAISERLAPAGPIQLDNRVRVTRDDYESSRP